MLLLTDDEISVHTLDADGYTFTPTTGTDAGNRQYLPSPATCTQRQLPTPHFLRPRRPAGVIRRRPELDTKQRAGFRRLLTSTAITINQHNPKSGASYERYEGYRFARLTSRNFQSWSGSSSRSLPQSSPMSSIVARACLGSIWRVRKSPSPWLLRDRVFEKLCCKECRMTAKTNSSPISSLRAEPKEEVSATINS